MVLDSLIARAQQVGRLGVDTEFVGEGRYRTQLCLVALIAGEGEECEVLLLDPLDEGTDLRALGGPLMDPAVEVVVHAGRQDIALLRRCVPCDEVTNIFDTQLAAGFAGLAAQASYDSLLREVLDIRLEKSQSFSRWDRRPLNEGQLSYAREDVLHLLDLAAALRRRLEANGRLEWAREECRSLASVSDERNPETLFSRLPKIGALKPQARAIARELLDWREALAERQDRPAPTVLSDAAIVELSRRRPATAAELAGVRGVNPGSLRRSGEELLEAITRGARREPIATDEARREERPSPHDAALVALCEALVRTRALEAHLAYELLASRGDLQAVVAAQRGGRGEAEVRTLRGWRRELIGAELLELLAGRVQLRAGDGGRLEVVSLPTESGCKP